MSGYLQALPITLAFEGGYTVDQGGPTYQGVTQNTYDSYRDATGQARRPVTEIEQDERDHLYFSNYWVAAQCDQLPWPLSMVHFDHAVNAGPKRAIQTLQEAILAVPDGRWGPQTHERLRLAKHDLHALMDEMLWARLAHYAHLAFAHPKKYGDDLLGWVRRVIGLRRKALELW